MNRSTRMGRRLCVAAALLLSTQMAFAQEVFDRPAPFSGSVSISGADRAPLYRGSTAEVSGTGFSAGQTVTLERGDSVLVEAAEVDGEGNFTASFDIPADAELGLHPVVVKTHAPDSAEVVSVKVSPELEIFGEEQFEITKSASLSGNLYQLAVSEANGTLFVTSAVGRPPVKESTIYKLDADTLEVLAEKTPEGEDERGSLFAVYGVAVDDTHGNVWVTQSRQDTIAVYSQEDLSLVKQFDAGTADHARDVLVDESRGRAYVSAATGGIKVFDTETLELVETIAVPSDLRGQEFFTTSLALNEEEGLLYTPSLTTPETAVIDVESGEVTVSPLTATDGTIGVDVSDDGSRLFFVSQGGDDLVITDTEGTLLADTPIGVQPLNVVYDDADGLAYVVNRGSDSLAVADSNGEVVANLRVGPQPNFVEEAGNGSIYVVNKAREGNEDSNTIWRVDLK
ncbi:YncE family protein [Celeribacter indicus]|uniref:Uncharacterized protein n=1 Tax=Celeribacter indicus TaxID=1208324 RepID=A0A0B5E2Z1_9RHOB|nr:hypothetical protein [Celeribacter indicus]AJE46817.1 hypothetical protein P73_2102 [Celeribacter indicus]SDW81192.1 DNA-binding beta-propeller fold protein YncE [Celeribacter indicus]